MSDERPRPRASKENDDPILDALRALPAAEVDPAAGDRVRRVALAAYVDEHTSRRPAWRSSVVQLWSRVGVPATLVVAAVIYLHWALAFTSTLFQ